jgi:hypothetical protein
VSVLEMIQINLARVRDIAPPGDSRYPPKGSEGQKPSDFDQRDSEIVALFFGAGVMRSR